MPYLVPFRCLTLVDSNAGPLSRLPNFQTMPIASPDLPTAPMRPRWSRECRDRENVCSGQSSRSHRYPITNMTTSRRPVIRAGR